MKILILHKHNRLTGVSTFIYTLTKALVQDGHEVSIWIENKDSASTDFEDNISKFAEIYFGINVPENKFDQIFINYNSLMNTALAFPHVPKKFFIHGCMYEDYVPPPENIDKYYVFSERVYKRMEERYSLPKEKVLIRNGIDIERFKYYGETNKEIQKILLIDSRTNGFLLNILSAVCNHLGIWYRAIGSNSYYNDTIWNMEDHVKDADLVIAYGRSAYEAMSMGKPTIIYGINGGDGYVTKDNFNDMLRTNMSGWSFKCMDKPHSISPNILLKEIQKYDHKDGIILSDMISKKLDIRLFIDKILDI